jgi:hypothetical protein
MAIDASTSAVGAIVRDAARGRTPTPQVDQETLGLVRERRDAPEERQLRALARMCLQHPALVGDETALTLANILPAGAWKSIILQIIEAANEGLLRPADSESDSRSVDAFLIESRLDEEARLRLREIAIDETPFDSERSEERVLEDLVGWFERRRLEARQRELNQRMRDPNADQDALLAEKQAQLLERRARLGVGSSGSA